MRILVCGGRYYSNRFKVHSVLNQLLEEHGSLTVIQGGATGADMLVREWCAKAMRPGSRVKGKVEMIEVPAEWETHGRKAGPIRNARMLEHKPDLVVAFPGGRGTADMIAKAREAGVEVREIEDV
jgi:predicted Rossmann-fold nucleotide-binding protein